MKSLKKFFLIMILIAISYVGFSQTPVGQYRVPTPTTPINVNLSAGTTIICLSDSTYWNVKAAGMASGLTLTTGRSFVDLVVKPTNLAQGTRTATTVPITSSTGTGATLSTATSTLAGVMDTTLYGKLNRVYNANTGDQKLTVDGSTTHATMTIGGAASDTVCVIGGGINKVSVSGKTVTVTGTEVDGSVSNEGALTVTAGTASTSVIHSNTSGSADVTIAAGTGMTISEDVGTGTITLNSTVSNHVYITEPFEEATTGATGTVHTLAHSPVTPSTGITVVLNTTVLTPSQFTNNGTGNKDVTITIPVYKYDKVFISYTY